jgi:hypothetical protein
MIDEGDYVVVVDDVGGRSIVDQKFLDKKVIQTRN